MARSPGGGRDVFGLVFLLSWDDFWEEGRIEAPWPGGSDSGAVSVVLGLDTRVIEGGVVGSVCMCAAVHRLRSAIRLLRCCARGRLRYG